MDREWIHSNIDKTDKKIISFRWKYVCQTKYNLIVGQDDNGKRGFIDKRGNVITWSNKNELLK